MSYKHKLPTVFYYESLIICSRDNRGKKMVNKFKYTPNEKKQN